MAVTFADSQNRTSLSRAARKGRLRRVARGIYTDELELFVEDVVARHRWEIVAHLVPDAVIVDRSAASGGAPAEGVLFVASQTRARDVVLPGLLVAVREAPRLSSDQPWAEGLQISSRARTLVDNLAVSRRRGKVARTLSLAELGDWVARQARLLGEERLNRLRDDAKQIAAELGVPERKRDIDNLVGAALGTRRAPRGSKALAARAGGRGYDEERVAMFEDLAGALARFEASEEVPGSLPEDTSEAGSSFAFWEAYFSNCIAGTIFSVEEAERIVETGEPPTDRSADGHDILGTHHVVVDPVERAKVPFSESEFLEILEPVAQNPTIPPAFCVGSDDQGMAYNFLPAERDQLYLMPPSLRDWLPKDHLALFVLDVVDELDLSGFYERYRKDGLGRAAYEPSVMVCVLLYAYCVGERSSRRIERRCTEDVAFRVLSVNQVPDHATIARFLASHEEAFSLLFCQVLALCATAGLVKLGIVALDGTKMAANASSQANATRSDLEAEAKRIVAEAIATDQDEDARYGDARGDELPADLCDPSSRRARIAEAKARLDEEAALRQAELAQRLVAKEAAEKTRTTRGGGRPLKEKRRRSEPRANITDPDSTIMRDSHGYLQGYNAQAAVTENQIILATHVTQEPSDNHQLASVVASAQENLMVAGVREAIGSVVADAGYWSQMSATVDAGPELFIATRTNRARAHPPLPSTGRIRASATALQIMERKLKTKRGRAIYAKRSISIEPVFGQIKETRRARRFHRRGLSAVDCEWKLLATTHNILKMWRVAGTIG